MMKSLEVNMRYVELLDNAKRLYRLLVSVSTGSSYKNPELIAEFEETRKILIQDTTISNLLPNFVRMYRDLPAFWGFIKQKTSGYAERRQYLAEMFMPLFNFLEENIHVAPLDLVVASAAEISSGYVREIWSKAIERRSEDPEGAITAARTLLEATFKHILDKQQIKYDDGADLTKLYKLVTVQLNLAPSQHTEQQFKQILGGAESVVNGLGSLRNRISDAHAISTNYFRPSPRHAVLCVNMAGAMSEFLISTFEHQLEMKSET